MDVAVDQILSPLLQLLLLLAAAPPPPPSFGPLSVSAQDNTTVTFPLPSGCPTSCGDFTFGYPFGIGYGCFRTGFDLTCNTTTKPPELFLSNDGSDAIEVLSDIDQNSDQYIFVKAPMATMGVEESSSYFSWTIEESRPYTISGRNSLWVIGCSASASLVDLTSNETVGTCETTCPVTESGPDPWYNVTRLSCNGIGCCCFQPHIDLKSYGIMLSRSNQATEYASSVNAFVAYFEGPTNYFSGDDGRSHTTVPYAEVMWKINDRPSCNDAMDEKSTYACLSLNSKCFDDYYGYHCGCMTDEGNPYVPEGCYDLPTRALPLTKCGTEFCGNTSIPFPFGLEEGCYKGTSFALTCNQTSNPPLLLFNLSDSVKGRVIDIKADEGQMEVSADINYVTFFSNMSMPFVFLQEGSTFGWVIDYFKTCEIAMQNKTDYACRSTNSQCSNRNVTGREGYFCKCMNGFQGNPYIPDGCRDIDECQDKEKYICHGDCVNTVGNYTCTCPPGTRGDPTKEQCTSDKNQSIMLGVIAGVCVGFGTLMLAVASVFATWKLKKIKQKRIRRRNFNQNHGLLLQQLIASNYDATEKTKIFSLKDLEKVTNNFDSLRIIGHGGHETVYKGILADQRVVAIKKSKITIRNKIDEFINEVAILSEVNHRNVVKLFGCCLETEVPLLVYEFISNGTLFDHLHGVDYKSTLSWLDRLRIASEAAGALAYLHSSAAISIFHRDMKSSNILLDEYFTAKVSDFGASRFIPPDKTHIFTAIQGTIGYLDPEYYQTCEFTDKSDVYSFGVVLLELLTGEKPISFILNGEERTLVVQFLQALKENRHFELMEARVKEEATREELDQIAKLAEICLKLKGYERPTMKEVEMKLQFFLEAKQQIRENRVPLLSNISGYDLPQHLVVQSSSQNTRNYSLEIEFINSMSHTR